MRRRRALAALAAGLTGGLAGCSGGGAGEPTTTGAPSETPTPTETATSTPTETTTPTPTPGAEVPTHGLGETFTVGEGDSAIGYTFDRFFRATELGQMGTEQADGTFLIVVLTVENPQSETITVPAEEIKLRGGGVIRNVDQNASQTLGADDRIDVKSLAATTVAPESSRQGGLVFDAPQGNDYRIEVGATDGGVTHRVPVGELTEIGRLPGGY